MDPDDDDFGNENEPSAPQKKRWLLKLLGGVVFFLAIAIAAIAYAYHVSQQEPEFYKVALRQSPEVARAKGAELETTVMSIYNSVLEQGNWRGEVSQDQINGWLATQLQQKFPELLPEDVVANPRVSISQGEISLAGHAHFQNLQGIVVAKLDIFKTDQKDQFAVRFRDIHVGVIPVPIKPFADDISSGLNLHGYQTMWTEIEGDPLLTVIVPEEKLMVHALYRVNIETIDLEEQKIIVSGTTINQVEEEANRVE